MNPSANYKDKIIHIIDEIEYLLNVSKDLNYDDFIKNENLKRAFVRSLEIIGEAVKQIPLKIKEKYEKIEWRDIAGMRDKLIHHYFGIDYFLVWDIVKNYIPKLKESISIIIDKEFKNNKN